MLVAELAERSFTKGGVETGFVVANDGQPAALLWAVRTKGRDDDVAAWSNRVQDLTNVGSSRLGIRQKVKDGPIVPEVVRVGWQRDLSDVANHEPHALCPRSEASSCGVERDLAEIGDRHLAERSGEQVVDQRRCTGPDVARCRSGGEPEPIDDLQGSVERRTKPTDVVALVLVDVIPVL